MSINLFPWRESLVEQKKIWLLKTSIISFFSMVTIGSLWYADSLYQLRKNQKTLQTLQLTAENVQAQYQHHLDKKHQETQQNIRIAFLNTQTQHFYQLIYLLETIGKYIPDAVFLTKIERDKNLIHLEGIADTHADIALYLKNMENVMQKYQPIISESKINHNDSIGIFFNLTYDISDID